MASLTVKEQLRSDLIDLKQDFVRDFDHIFKPHAQPTGQEAFSAVVPPIETWIDTEDNEFHLTMPLPGIKPEALKITLEGKQLTFTGEQKQEEDKSTKKYLEREISYGRFARTVNLPDGVDGEKMTAELKDGILEITAPIAVAALPKKIEVKNLPTNGDQK